MSRLYGRRQVQKCDEYLDRQAPRPDIYTLATQSSVNTEDVRAVPLCASEVRRRDVGVQRYGVGVPTLAPGFHEKGLDTLWSSVASPDVMTSGSGIATSIHQTSIGAIKLTDPHPRRDLGSVPTQDTLNFLKHEYQGSRFNPPKPRFYS